MKHNSLIKIKTISAEHVSQLPYEHYWDGEYDWSGKKIIGRIASDGFILVQFEKTKELHKIAPIAFLDWKLSENGCKQKINGRWVYAPLPHTEYSRKAQEAYGKIPQLFIT